MGTLTFNYSNVFFSFYFDQGETCTHMVKDHMLAYGSSGELLIENGDARQSIQSGECVFLKKNHKVTMTNKPKDGEQFRAVFLVFSRNFLREYYRNMDKSKLPKKIPEYKVNLVKLPQKPDITSLFQSIIPYFDSSIKPSKSLMDLKLLEGVEILLNVDIVSSVAIFDFVEPWKIDLADFMNENYMYELSLEEIASFTGRSLATFKRDLKKISELSPQKWIFHRRLKEAKRLIKEENKKVSDIYLGLGFKSLSHFSQAYKKQFGLSPTS